MNSVLSVQGLRQNYGGVEALKGVDFELKAGEFVALIGPNGAGKSTCFAWLANKMRWREALCGVNMICSSRRMKCAPAWV